MKNNFAPIIIAADRKTGSADLTLYGNVVKSRPIDWATWNKSTDDYIVEKEILDQIDSLGSLRKLNLRINSLGGDVSVAIVIYNRLRQMADNGTKISAYIDGVAMSAGSMIMCAADKVSAGSSSLIMIHKSMCNISGYLNADELRKLAENNDAFDKAIAAAYKRKTGKCEEDILRLMSNETYMTGEEAKTEGFVDELFDSETEIAACADKKSLLVHGRIFDLGGAPLPGNIQFAVPDIRNDIGNLNKLQKPDEGGKPLMATNLDELKKENPELAAAIEKEIKAQAEKDNKAAADSAAKDALEAERNRIAELDKFADVVPAEILEDAKYTNPCSAEQMGYKVLLAMQKQGQTFLDNLKTDNNNGGAQSVPGASAPETIPGKPKTDTEMQAEADMAVHAFFAEEKEGK